MIVYRTKFAFWVETEIFFREACAGVKKD